MRTRTNERLMARMLMTLSEFSSSTAQRLASPSQCVRVPKRPLKASLCSECTCTTSLTYAEAILVREGEEGEREREGGREKGGEICIFL